MTHLFFEGRIMLFQDKRKQKVLLIYTAIYFMMMIICYFIYPYSDYKYHIYEKKELNIATPLFFQNIRPYETIRFIQDETSYGIDCRSFQLCKDLSNATLLNAKYIIKVKTCQKAGVSMTQKHGKYEWFCNIYFEQARFKTNTGNIIDYQLPKQEVNEILGKQDFPFGAFVIWYFISLLIISMLYDIFVKSKYEKE